MTLAPRSLAAILAATLWSASGASGQVQFEFAAKRHHPEVAWGAVLGIADVDHDGLPDLLVGGDFFVRQVRHGRFASVRTPLGALRYAYATSFAAGDIDRDGRVDLVFGNAESGFGTTLRIYFAQANGPHRETTLRIDGVSGEDIALADADGDGDPDLFTCGRHSPLWAERATVLANDGRGAFTVLASLPHGDRALAVGDVDADGDVDLVLTRVHAPDELYLNDGRGGFRLAPAGSYPVRYDASLDVELGDVDGDRDLDVVTAASGAALFLNDGSGRFVDVTASHMPAPSSGFTDLELVDIDRDGDVDVVSGEAGGGRIYRNDGSGRFADAASRVVQTSWRRTPSVEAADLDRDGSIDLVLSGDRTRVLLQVGPLQFADGALPDVERVAATALVAGDFDRDGDIDAVFATPGGTGLLLNDGHGRFADATRTHMPAPRLDANHYLPIDVDTDGDRDLVLGCGTGSLLSLFVNDGSARFTDATAGRFPPFAGCRIDAIEAMDVDADGDVDIVMSGYIDAQPHVHRLALYVNDGSGRFTDQTASRIPTNPVFVLTISVGDIDGDRDDDLVLGTSTRNLVLRNDGRGTLHDDPNALPGDSELTTDSALFDADGDGDFDVLFANPYAGCRLSTNDGSGRFAPAPLPAVAGARLVVADFDGDGRADVLVHAEPYDSDTSLLVSDGAGRFRDVTVPRIQQRWFARALATAGDVDGDGDVDLLMPLGSVWVASNLLRQVRSPYVTRVGQVLELEFIARFSPGTGDQWFVPFFAPALATTPLVIPGIGSFHLDTTVAITGTPDVIGRGDSGTVSLHVPIANDPNLVGLRLHTQALFAHRTDVASWRLSNLVSDTFLP